MNLNQIRELRGDERIENALNLAKREFKVPKLFNPKGKKIFQFLFQNSS